MTDTGLLDASDVAVTGPAPDRVVRLPVEGGSVVAYVYGDAHAETVLCINGGPGVASHSMREAYCELARRGYRVVIHDQLGTGASDCPDDPSLWTLRRYVAEVEAVRQALGRGKVHLFGHSWGGWLGIEYAVTRPDKLKSAIFSSTSADMPTHLVEVRRLLAALGEETLTVIDRWEAEGNTDNDLYRAICTHFYGRHSSRRLYREGKRPRGKVNMQVQVALWGPAEFSATGELAAWNRLPDLKRVTVPALVTVGAYDYLTPKSAGLIHAHLPDARLVLFPESGHAPYVDEPEAYFGTVQGFLDGVTGRTR